MNYLYVCESSLDLFFIFQQEDRKHLLRSQANQLLKEAKEKGRMTSIEHESPTLEVNPIVPTVETPPEFRKNPFTLLKKTNLKQLPKKQLLKSDTSPKTQSKGMT